MNKIKEENPFKKSVRGKTKLYKEFELFCKENKLTFNDDNFSCIHLDSGNLFYLYDKIVQKCEEQKRKEVEWLKAMIKKESYLNNSNCRVIEIDLWELIDEAFKGEGK